MFQSTPSGGKATVIRALLSMARSRFQSTPSGGKATGTAQTVPGAAGVSIHAFRGEGDACRWASASRRSPVSIHAFRGEGDRCRDRSYSRRCSFNPRLPGGRRPDGDLQRLDRGVVSIHAFRGEGDGARIARSRWRSLRFNPRLPGGRRRSVQPDVQRVAPVSIHAFRGEGDARGRCGLAGGGRFQSTPSGGKATSARAYGTSNDGGFNPRLPGGRRRVFVSSITSTGLAFQSTPSGGKATKSRTVV